MDMITNSTPPIQSEFFFCPGNVGNSNPLFPLNLPRSRERLYPSLANIRIRPFKGEALGTMAVTAAAVWFYFTAPTVRNPSFALVRLTAHALAERYGFTPPTNGDVVRAVDHPEKFWRQLPPAVRHLATNVFQNLRPQAQHPRHVYGVDYTFVPVNEGGATPTQFVPFVAILDLYTRYIVAFMLLSRRPCARDFEEILFTLFAANLLPSILRSDNEGCFTALSILRLLQYLDVLHERIPPAMPQENGRPKVCSDISRKVFFPKAECPPRARTLESSRQ